ncbi:MAG: AsnC family transcriptional regulator [Hyphomicrobiales bacterium]
MNRILDDLDRRIVNRLQVGIAITDEPFAAVANELGIETATLLVRLCRLKTAGVLSRVGPMYNAERFGGALSLCAMTVPKDRFEGVAELVNAFPEVAHNYAREHRLNMWFVLATETAARRAEVVADIERLTDIKVLDLPKLHEFYIGLKVQA